MNLSLLPFILLAFHSLLPSAISSYYQVIPSRTPENSYTLRCRLEFNDPQDGIEWLFNGSDYRSSSCFAGALVAANRLTFNHSSDCDGYIQCGNGTEYSVQVQLKALPKHTPFFQPGQINIVRPWGTSVTFPCNVIVSAIGGLNVRWVKNAGSLDEEQIMSLNEDYSITLTDLEPTSTPIFYRCDVITTSGVFRGQVFSLKVVRYSPPHITGIVPSDDDEDEIEIVLSASGTNLNFSWFLDGIELKNGVNGENSMTFQSNGVSRSVLELPRSIITRARNLTGIASNIDRTNSSDLRGMGSGVVRNRSDSVQLWLYPAVAPIPTQTTTPTSELLCNRKADIYTGLFVASIVVVLVLILIIVAISVLLCYKSHRTYIPEPENGNQYVQPQYPGCIEEFTKEQRQSVNLFILKLTGFIGKIGSQQYTSEEVQLLALKITNFLSEASKEPTRKVKTDSPPEETQVFDGGHSRSSSYHKYEEIPYSTTTKPAELQCVTMLGAKSTSAAAIMEEDVFIKNMFEGIDLKTVCKAMSQNL